MENKTFIIKHPSYIREWKREEATYNELAELLGVTGEKLDNSIETLVRIGTFIEKESESQTENESQEESQSVSKSKKTNT